MAPIFFIIYSILISGAAYSTVAATTYRIDIRRPATIDASRFQAELPATDPRILKELTCRIDARYAPEQIAPLLGLTVGMPITATDLAAGLNTIAKQERFVEVTILIEHDETDQISLLLTFRTGFVIDRISISGALIGKQRYRQAYLLHAGELFDIERHQAGIARIETALHDEGYWGAHISATIQEDVALRIVSIKLHIILGARYRVEALTVDIIQGDTINNTLTSEDQRITRRIKRHLDRSLLRYSYDRTVLNQETNRVTQLLIHEGYLGASFQLNERIKHDKQSVELHFSLKLGSKALFTFHGNRYFTKKELLERILLFGSSTTLIPPALLADELRTLYEDHGFWQIDITWKEDGIRTFFFISEGPRAKIRTIALEGISPAHKTYILKQFGKDITKSRYFRREQILDFLNQIVEYYHKHGFWEASIERYEYLPCSQDEYTLSIQVTEGNQRWLSSIEFDPSCPISRPNLLASKQRIPIAFDIALLKEQRTILINDLRMQGRMYAQPTPEIIDTGNYQMAVRWRCETHPEIVHIDNIIVQGNGRIDENIILRECLFAPGQAWNPDTLAKSALRLKSLDLFESISILPDNIAHPEYSKSVIIHAIPDAPHELRTRFGVQGVNRNIIQWNGGASPKIGLSYIAKNPAKNGDVLRADFDYARYMHDLALSYHIPWIGNHRVGAELQCVSARYDQPLYIGSPQVLYRTSYDGITVSSSRTYGILSGGASCSVARMGLRAAPCNSCGTASCARQAMIAQALNVDPLFFILRPWYLLAEITGMCDTRDDKINPRDGTLTVLALQGIVPPTIRGGSFIKLLLEHSLFFSPLAFPVPVVCGLRLRVGAICGADFSRIMPPERFYIGGSHSLRSYEADYAPPLNTFITCSNRRCIVPTGGKYMMNGNMELRFPLYNNLGGILFVDIGMLSGELLPVTVLPHHMMGAIGCGLRFNTVIGPLRFDIGWKLKRDTTTTGIPVHDRRYAWFMTLGHAF